ncbi:MAG: DUF58 domain-containing protein [Chloroflexi bacterium]|nr:DUF58 domain-containing protein [Chloroflexota bacterium]
MKKRLILIVIPLVILTLALAIGSVLLLRLFSLIILVLLLSYLWTWLGVRGISGQVKKLAERCQVGEWFGEEITVFNASWLPKLMIKIEGNTDLPGYHSVDALNLAPKNAHCWQTKVYCGRRGQYRLGALTATVTDPFGFFSARRNLGESQSIIVYPATLELPFFQPLSRSEPGPGHSRWLISEVGPNAARVREYASGDTLRHIHWQSTAHTGKLMVKEFDADHSYNAARNIWIILDMYRASQAGDGDDSTEEYGVTIAASLLKKYLDSGKKVGLIASGDQPYLFLPQVEEIHLSPILEALALMKATGEVPIEQLIAHELERFGTGSATIVITPSVSERILAPLRQVRSRGAPVIVILLDAASFGSSASAVSATSQLAAGGMPVYVVKCGDKLAKALDSRARISR